VRSGQKGGVIIEAAFSLTVAQWPQRFAAISSGRSLMSYREIKFAAPPHFIPQFRNMFCIVRVDS